MQRLSKGKSTFPGLALDEGNEMSETLIVEGFEPFAGKHCETTALKRELDYHGLATSLTGIASFLALAMLN